MPLSEIISAALNVDEPSSQAVWKVHNALVGRFGNEYSALLDASKEELYEIIDTKVAEAILNVRAGRLTVVPGFDGVYGKLVLGEAISSDLPRLVKRGGIVQQSSLVDFW